MGRLAAEVAAHDGQARVQLAADAQHEESAHTHELDRSHESSTESNQRRGSAIALLLKDVTSNSVNEPECLFASACVIICHRK